MGADLAQEVLGVAGLGDDLEARLLQEPPAPSRRMTASSAITTRMGSPPAAPSRPPAAGDLEPAVERGHLVAQTPQAGAPRGFGAAAAVVADLDAQEPVGMHDLNLGLPRRRVAGDVGHGLRDDEVRRGLDRRRESRRRNGHQVPANG